MEASLKQEIREARLDALRGIASLSVAAGHCVTAFEREPLYNKTFLDLNYESRTAIFLRFLHLLFNANAAVIIFFVLSGYVLTKSLSRVSSDLSSEFLIYVIKRIYRILPTVIISFMAVSYFIDRPAWEYIQNMLLLKVSVNGVTWTLQVEMVASLLIFLVFIVNKKARVLIVPFFLLLVALFLVGYKPLFFKYFPAFFLGCYVGIFRQLLLGRENYFVPVAILLFLSADFFLGYDTRPTVAVVTVASVIMIACASSSNFFKFLDHNVFGFLGKISFSFYLYHLTGALIVARGSQALGIHLHRLHPIVGTFIYMVTTIPLAVVLATLSYHLIEKPSISAGADVNRAVKRLSLVFFGTKESVPADD